MAMVFQADFGFLMFAKECREFSRRELSLSGNPL
jgi:hypothetical protein